MPARTACDGGEGEEESDFVAGDGLGGDSLGEGGGKITVGDGGGVGAWGGS